MNYRGSKYAGLQYTSPQYTGLKIQASIYRFAIHMFAKYRIQNTGSKDTGFRYPRPGSDCSRLGINKKPVTARRQLIAAHWDRISSL